MQISQEQSLSLNQISSQLDQNEQKGFSLRDRLSYAVKQKTQILIQKKYIIYELIESDDYCDAFKAINNISFDNVLVKIIYKNFLKQHINHTSIQSEQQNQLLYEQKIKKIYLECYIQSKYPSKTESYVAYYCNEVFENQYLLMKICQDHQETLQKVIKKRNSLPFDQAITILKQIILGLSVLMKQGIILTEINPKHIIFKNGAYKINHFSSFKKVSEKFSSSDNAYDSTIAPELNVFPQIVDIKSQIWALGILFYMMTAVSPYESRAQQIYVKIRQSQINFEMKNGYSEEQALSFLLKLLTIDPIQRISWKNLINHEIFQNGHYFYSIKINPLINFRITTIKKVQNLVLEQEIQTQKTYVALWYQRMKQKIIKIDNNNFYEIIETKNNIDPCKMISNQNMIYKRFQEINLVILKANYIFNQILLQLIQLDLINQKKRSHIELIYLMIFRCSKYISLIKKESQKILKESRILNYIEQIKLLDSNIEIKFVQFKNKLKKKDDQKFYLSNDVFSFVVNHKNFNEKNKLLRGREGHQYSVEQQISFTQEKCLNKFITEIKQLKLQIKKVQDLKRKLLNYSKINSITLEELQKSSSFQDYINKVLK